MILRIITVVGLGIGFSNAVLAGGDQWHSAHFCQVVGPTPQAVAYHSAGSIIALTDDVRVSCPIKGTHNLGTRFSAKVSFRTDGARGGNLIKCWINRINGKDQADQGEPRAAGIETTDVLTISSGSGVLSPAVGGIAGSIVCELRKNAKILGYFADRLDP